MEWSARGLATRQRVGRWPTLSASPALPLSHSPMRRKSRREWGEKKTNCWRLLSQRVNFGGGLGEARPQLITNSPSCPHTLPAPRITPSPILRQLSCTSFSPPPPPALSVCEKWHVTYQCWSIKTQRDQKEWLSRRQKKIGGKAEEAKRNANDMDYTKKRQHHHFIKSNSSF